MASKKTFINQLPSQIPIISHKISCQTHPPRLLLSLQFGLQLHLLALQLLRGISALPQPSTVGWMSTNNWSAYSGYLGFVQIDKVHSHNKLWIWMDLSPSKNLEANQHHLQMVICSHDYMCVTSSVFATEVACVQPTQGSHRCAHRRPWIQPGIIFLQHLQHRASLLNRNNSGKDCICIETL